MNAQGGRAPPVHVLVLTQAVYRVAPETVLWRAASDVGAQFRRWAPTFRFFLAQRDVVDQRVRGIGGISVVVDVEPEDDSPPTEARRELVALPRPAPRVRAHVEDRRQRRAGGVPDLHLDLVVADAVRAVRVVEEVELA